MPPLRKKGKEPKETVVYPSSKRPAPPFKPLRPSKVPRIATTGSESSVAAARPTTSKPTAAARKPPPFKSTTSRAKDVEENDSSKTLSSDHEEEEDDQLPDFASARARQKAPAPIAAPQNGSPVSISSNEIPQARVDDPMPSQSDPTPSIPQPLLLRLLHEGFADKNTKIDKHAIQVLQKYMEIFVREAIARAKHAKLEAGDESGMGGTTWLDVNDLENVAAGLLVDF